MSFFESEIVIAVNVFFGVIGAIFLIAYLFSIDLFNFKDADQTVITVICLIAIIFGLPFWVTYVGLPFFIGITIIGAYKSLNRMWTQYLSYKYGPIKKKMINDN